MEEQTVQKKKSNVGLIIAFIIILLISVAGSSFGGYLFGKADGAKYNAPKKETEKTKKKNKYIFAYLDDNNEIKLLTKDKKIVTLKDKSISIIMENGLKYDDNKLYYLDKEGYFHSVDLTTDELKDKKYDIKIELGDPTYDGVKTFFVKDETVVFRYPAKKKVIKVDLNTGKENSFTNDDTAIETYYNFYTDSIYLDVQINVFDPYEVDIINSKGLVKKLPYHLSYKNMTNDYALISTEDNDLCIYNAKTEKIINCTSATRETTVIDKDNYYQAVLYKDTIAYIQNGKVYVVQDGKDILLYTIEESIKDNDWFHIYPTDDEIILDVSKDIYCYEGCVSEHKYYYIKDKSIVPIEDVGNKHIKSYIAIN